jgi:hypothetical protein
MVPRPALPSGGVCGHSRSLECPTFPWRGQGGAGRKVNSRSKAVSRGAGTVPIPGRWPILAWIKLMFPASTHTPGNALTSDGESDLAHSVLERPWDFRVFPETHKSFPSKTKVKTQIEPLLRERSLRFHLEIHSFSLTLCPF